MSYTLLVDKVWNKCDISTRWVCQLVWSRGALDLVSGNCTGRPWQGRSKFSPISQPRFDYSNEPNWWTWQVASYSVAMLPWPAMLIASILAFICPGSISDSLDRGDGGRCSGRQHNKTPWRPLPLLSGGQSTFSVHSLSSVLTAKSMPLNHISPHPSSFTLPRSHSFTTYSTMQY